MSLRVPYVKSYGQTSFYYTGIHAWNELPFSIQSVQNMRQLKCLLKQFLFSCLNDQEASSSGDISILFYIVIINVIYIY